MTCKHCANKIDEGMEYCPHCGKSTKEPKTKFQKIKDVVGLVIVLAILAYIGVQLIQGKSFNEIMHPSRKSIDASETETDKYDVKLLVEPSSTTDDTIYNPEGGGDVDPRENDSYTYSAPVVNNSSNESSEENQTTSERPYATREMLMTAEDWEGTYRRNDGLMMSLYKNDDESMLLTIGDETGTWIYIQDEVAMLSENGAGVIYKDSYYDFVVEYASGEDVYFITQYDNSGDDFSGTYYLK